MSIEEIDIKLGSTTKHGTPMETIHCPNCGPDNDFSVRYRENFDSSLLKFTPRKTPEHMHFRVVQCTSCGLIYSNPILSQDDIVKLYRHSDFFFEPQLKNMVEDYLSQVDKIIDRVNKGNLLEIGCSSGFFLEKAKKYGFEGVYGIEPSEIAVEHAPSGIRDCIINDKLKPGLFPDEHFDLICFFQIFDHILDPNDFLQTVFKYLKKGGMILAIHHDIRTLMPTIFGSRASTYDISHIHLWDKHTMRRILEKNHFEVSYIKGISTRYQLDYILRMFPLPSFLKESLRKMVRMMGLSDVCIKARVENMVIVAYKK